MGWGIDKGWTLFLDRDGVINQRIFGAYVRSVEEFRFKSDFLAIAGFLAEKFDRIIVVTNQQGISKGLMTESNLSEIHRYMMEVINVVSGRIDHIFYAANAKGEFPDRRKPNPAMALEAKKLFPEIDFSKSVMVGDTDSDLRFGRDLGMKTVLVRSEEIVYEKADLIVDNLEELKLLM